MGQGVCSGIDATDGVVALGCPKKPVEIHSVMCNQKVMASDPLQNRIERLD